MGGNALILDTRLENLNIVEVGLDILGDKVSKRPINPYLLNIWGIHAQIDDLI